MKALLVALAAVAALLVAAGGVTLALERRLATLTPGGVEIDTLEYNPLSGRLRLAGVRARDADGREVFQAEGIAATASPLPLLVGSLTLSRMVVESPRLTLSSPAMLATALPVRIEDVAVTGGRVVIEHAGGGPPLRADDLELRLGRLTTARAGQPDLAFACELVTSGTLVRVTGQPRGTGYALHVRAQDVDVVRLARELPGSRVTSLRGGRGEVDAVLHLAGGRLLAAGRARVADLVVALPVRGQPRLRAASVTVVADGFDLFSGAGRIARVMVDAPSLSLPVATAAPTLAALLDWLRAPADVLVRRIAVTDGTLALTGAGGVRLRHVQVAAGASERTLDEWAVTARAALDGGADVALDGRLARDLRALDAAARMSRGGVTPWRGLTGTAIAWDSRVSFEGRLRVAAREGAVTLTGQTSLADESAVAEGRGHVPVYRSVASTDPGSTIRQLLIALEDAVHLASAAE